MVLMNLFARKEWTGTYREGTSGHRCSLLWRVTHQSTFTKLHCCQILVFILDIDCLEANETDLCLPVVYSLMHERGRQADMEGG